MNEGGHVAAHELVTVSGYIDASDQFMRSLKAAPASQAERWARAAVEKIVEGDLVVASLLELVGEAIEHGWLATASVESVAHVESVICRAKTWQNTR